MKRLLIAFALLTPLSVNAASFDCQKAQAADEKACCTWRSFRSVWNANTIWI